MTEIFVFNAFKRDIRKLKDKKYELIVKKILLEAKTNGLYSILKLPEVVDIKKIQGHSEDYYRIRIKHGVGHRIGIELTDEGIYFLKTGKRKDFYRRFP
ncbi:MAG: hypothetical protein PF693_10090 [Spirochaetia bacterium]|jgi:mRNA-degrading endonuclease RelE of RelBE toxin-antitoxin system|nr:hypothetical protein [Spirochaetia bacterium]